MSETEKTEQPATPPVAKIINPVGREKIVALEYPVEFDGKVYSEIKVRRITAKELQDYFNALATSTEPVLPPMIECPMEVWQAMDDDDQMAVDDVAQDFSPRRLKAAVKSMFEAGGVTSGS